MIILRQKAFTRAEREALKQLYLVSRGIRRFPGGVTNLEDAKALKELAIKLNEGNPNQNIASPSIRKALDNLGLTRLTDKELNHLNQKYNNPATYNRLIRINPNLSGNKKLEDILKKTVSEDKANNIVEQEAAHKALLQEKEPVTNQNIIRFIRKHPGNSVVEVKSEPLSIYLPNKKEVSPALSDIMKDKSVKLVNPSGINGKQMKLLRKHKLKKGLILTNKKYPPFYTLHEKAHNINTKTIPNSDNYMNSKAIVPVYRKVVSSVGEVAEENLASSRALNIMKNQSTAPASKSVADKYLNSYVIGAKSSLQ